MIKRFLFLLVLGVSMISCFPEDDFQTDEEKIQEYIKDNNISDAIKASNGIYIQHIVEGEGLTIADGIGKSVLISYKIKELETGALLKESSVIENLNINNLIYGMQVGLQYMKTGGQAKFYIPGGAAWGGDNIIVEVTLEDFSEYYLTSDEIIQNYFNVNEVTDTIADPSGVYIKHIEEGDGELADGDIDKITVKYTAGYVVNGQIVDQQTTGIVFTLDNLYLGWQIAIPYMKKGGKAWFYIPSELANNDGEMMFQVELVDFTLNATE